MWRQWMVTILIQNFKYLRVQVAHSMTARPMGGHTRYLTNRPRGAMDANRFVFSMGKLLLGVVLLNLALILVWSFLLS